MRVSFSTLHIAAVVLWLGSLVTAIEAIEAGTTGQWGMSVFKAGAALGGLFLGLDVWRAA